MGERKQYRHKMTKLKERSNRSKNPQRHFYLKDQEN